MKTVYCINKENRELIRYELKAPDYELIKNRQVPSFREDFKPRRYTLKEGVWVSHRSERTHAQIMFTGDITCFAKQFEYARTEDGYDFNFEFDEIRPVFAESDLVVGNLETMIFPAAPYRTEKLVSEQNYYCNAPIEFLEAVRNAGFDMVTNANNHDLDTGALGIGETIDQIERIGLLQTGTFKIPKKRYELLRVCGFTIAIVAFATEHNNKRCNLTKEGGDFLLQNYSKEKAKQIAREARDAGAELVFVCIHWGIEHKLVQNKAQEKVALELAECGYDCIIGSHPHVLQPFSYIEVSNKRVPVFYSMGNFVSHNSLNNKSRSIIACIELKRKDRQVEMQCSYIPIYTSWEYNNKKYVVIPIFDNAVIKRNLQKKTIISRIVGDKIPINTAIQLKECVEDTPIQKNSISQEILDLSNVKDYPVYYTRGRLSYEVYRDHACIIGASDGIASGVLPEAVLGQPITEAREEVFANNPSLAKININRNLKQISKGMFKNCPALEGVRLGFNISEIDEEAFANCPRLAAIVMRKNMKKIGKRAFANCPALVTVKITSGVQEIAEDAFVGSSSVRVYCEKESFAEKFAKRMGIPYTIMSLYEG